MYTAFKETVLWTHWSARKTLLKQLTQVEATLLCQSVCAKCYRRSELKVADGRLRPACWAALGPGNALSRLWFLLSPADAVFKIWEESAFLWHTFGLGKFFLLCCGVFCVPSAAANAKYWDYSRMGICSKDSLSATALTSQDNITLDMQYPFEAKNYASWSTVFSPGHSWLCFLTVNIDPLSRYCCLWWVPLKAMVSGSLLGSFSSWLQLSPWTKNYLPWLWLVDCCVCPAETLFATFLLSMQQLKGNLSPCRAAVPR